MLVTMRLSEDDLGKLRRIADLKKIKNRTKALQFCIAFTDKYIDIEKLLNGSK